MPSAEFNSTDMACLPVSTMVKRKKSSTKTYLNANFKKQD